MSSCALCGRSTDDHNRHVRFRLPDPVVAAPAQDRTEGIWTTDPDPNAAVMMQLPGLGGFVRALLPVHLSGGYTVTFGVWVGLHPDDLKRAFEVWWAPEYPQLRLEGRLANALPAWEVFAVPVTLAVVDPDATPYVVGSSDAELSSVLVNEWDHDKILSGLPR